MTERLKLPPLPTAARVITDFELARLKKKNASIWCSRSQQCQTCKGAGWFTSFENDSIVEYDCDCLNQMILSLWFANAGLANDQMRASWQDILAVDPAAEKIASGYVDDIEANVSRGRGLILQGSAGIGKTLLATLVLKWGMAHGFDGQFFLFPSFLDAYAAGWDNSEDRDWFYQKAGSTPLLVIDDVGKEADSRSGSSIMESFEIVIQNRVNAGLPTILSTNLTPQQLQNRYGGHIFSRLNGYADLIEMSGEDFRPMHNGVKATKAEHNFVSPVRWK